MRDVVVVGAGPGGSATAAYLAREGLQVTLVDKQRFPRDKTCGDAISPRAVHVLADLGIMGAIAASGQRIRTLAATGPRGTAMRTDLPAEAPFARKAYVIRRLELDELIRQAAVEAGAEFSGGVHVRELEKIQEGWRIWANHEGRARELQARILVLAVGASTPLLRDAGLLAEDVEYSYAARAYFRGLTVEDRVLHFRFDGVPLPGYGWVFPLGNGEANVGAGYYRRTKETPPTATATMKQFLAHPRIKRGLGPAEQMGPIKGFPLRTDFHRSRVVARRLLVVGEAAGLVNPFTGEGIDYALESGQLAARTLIRCFQEGNFGPEALRPYDRVLRERFQETFVLTHWLRRLYMNDLLLDPLIRAGRRWPELAERLTRIFLSYESPRRALTPAVALKVLRSFG